MGNYFNKQYTCEICDSFGFDYESPLIKFLHIGKYNNKIYCFDCLKAKMNYENLRNKNKYIVYD